MIKVFWLLGSILALLAVATGAFGAHVLQERLPPDRLNIFEIAARYQMYHALALFVVTWATSQWSGQWATAAGWLFVAGVFFFSGSLYILALTDVRWMGAIAPIGGASFIAGWACLAMAAWRG